MLKNNHRGRYNNDYSPQYSDPYDIYDKAKEHMKKLRNEERHAKQAIMSPHHSS